MGTYSTIARSLADYLTSQTGGFETVSPTTNLLESGILESLTMMDLIAHIEQRYGVALAPGDITPMNFQSTDRLSLLVEGKLKQAVAA